MPDSRWSISDSLCCFKGGQQVPTLKVNFELVNCILRLLNGAKNLCYIFKNIQNIHMDDLSYKLDFVFNCKQRSGTVQWNKFCQVMFVKTKDGSERKT